MARNLKTVSQFATDSVWSEAQLRWMIFHAATNGLQQSGAVVRCGRRVYLDEAAFDRWLVSQNPGLQQAST
ncbi:MAG TPA: DNA-binding protein [Pseudoxanthomonas sp.]|nr:DNA-binding protein [Pseudoxanthomonas sp.]